MDVENDGCNIEFRGLGNPENSEKTKRDKKKEKFIRTNLNGFLYL